MSEGRKTDWKGGLEYQSSPFSSRFSSLHWGYFWSFYVTGQVNLQENGYIKYTLLHAENSCKMQRPIWDIVFIPSACCAAQLGHSKKTNERPVLAVCPQKFSPKILFDVPQKSKTFCWPDVGSRNLRMLNTSFLYLLYTYPQPTETCLPSQENRNWVFCYWKQFIPVYLFWQTTIAISFFQEERFVLRHMERQEPQGEENGDLAAFAHHHGLSPRHQVPTVPGGQLPTSVNHQVILLILAKNIQSRPPIEMRIFHRNERCRISAILQHKFSNLPSKPSEYRRKFHNLQISSDHVQNVYWL